MDLARHPYATARVALAAASLIAVTPVAPPALDLQEHAVQLTALDPGTVLGEIPGILQTNISAGLNEISAGVTALGAGEWVTGLDDFATAPANLFLDPSENIFLGLVDALAGQPLVPNDFESTVVVPPAVTLTGLVTNLQEFTQTDLTFITSGLGELAQGTVNGGLASILAGLDNLFYLVPKDLFIDSLSVLAETLDPGAVAAAVDPAALGGLAADLPTLLLSLIP